MATDLAKAAKDRGIKYFMISYTDLFGTQRVHARLEHRDDLFFRALNAVEADVGAREGLPAACPEQDRDHEEVDSLKHDRAVGDVDLAVVDDLFGSLGPVTVGLEVVADVIAVVEAAAVVAGVDAGDGVDVAVAGARGIDERVLAPVAPHHQETDEDKRQQEDEQGADRSQPKPDARDDVEPDFAN